MPVPHGTPNGQAPRIASAAYGKCMLCSALATKAWYSSRSQNTGAYQGRECLAPNIHQRLYLMLNDEFLKMNLYKRGMLWWSENVRFMENNIYLLRG